MYKNEMILEKLGGKTIVAQKLGISKGAVYLWFYKKPSGMDGKIPPKQAIKIFNLAKKRGIECTIDDILG